MAAKIVLLACILMIGVLLARELWRYREEDPLVTRGQLIKRLIVGVWLQGVLGMAAVGDEVTAGMPPLYRLAYWGSCLLFATGPIFAAIHEAGRVARQYARRRAELFRSLSLPPPHDDRSRQS
jgi:hypothetical protein